MDEKNDHIFIRKEGPSFEGSTHFSEDVPNASGNIEGTNGVINDDAEDIQHWVESHFSPLYGFAYRLTGSDCDAEDLVQETFLVALRKGEQLRQSETPQVVRSWLFTILRRLFWKRHRHKRKRKNAKNSAESLHLASDPLDSSDVTGCATSGTASGAVGDAADEVVSDAADREIREILTSDFSDSDDAWDFVDPCSVSSRHHEQTIDSEQLQLALDALPPEFRIVTLMYSLEQRTYREIADALQIPIGTVMSRIARARKMLRQTLEKMLE